MLLNVSQIEQTIEYAAQAKALVQEHVVGASPGFLDDIINALADVIRSIEEKILRGVGALFQPIVNVSLRIEEKLGGIVDSIADRVRNIFFSIDDKIGKAVDNILANLKSAANAIVSELSTRVGDIWGWLNDVKNTVGGFVTKAVGDIKGFTDNVGNAIKQKVNDLGGAIASMASNAVENVKNALGGAIDALKGAWETVTTKIGEILRNILEKIKEALEKLKETLEKAIGEALEWADQSILKPLANTFENAKEHIAFKEQVLLKAALGQYRSFDEFANDIADPIPVLGALGAILGGLLLGAVVAPGISMALSPAFENLQHLAAEKFHNYRLDQSTAIAAYFKGALPKDKMITELAQQGYNPWQVDVAIEAARPLPDLTTLYTGVWRGIINTDRMRATLERAGFCERDVNLLVSLAENIPPPSDIIHMAVREAFSPEVAERFGQYEDFPKPVEDYLAKAGFSAEWAKRYWAAHWNLPSPSQGFEMYHRGIITYDELKTLLRALDVMPFWRDRLIALSESVPTRVDVRRLYSTGIYTEDDVYQSYKKLGYSDKDAQALTVFTLQNYAPEEETESDRQRKLTSSLVVDAAKRGLMTEKEALTSLVDMGYSQENAEFLLTYSKAKDMIADEERILSSARTQVKNTILKMAKQMTLSFDDAMTLLVEQGYSSEEAETMLFSVQLEHEFEMRQSYIAAIAKSYLAGGLPRNDAIAALAKLNLSAAEQEYLLQAWELERAGKTRRATEAQYRAAVKAGLITVDEYKTALQSMGYADRDVELLAALLSKGG